MEKNLGNLNPLNEDKFFEEFESLEETARKEKIQSILQERNEILDSNRNLFARAKTAECFKQDDDGNWIKNIEKEPKAKSGKSDDKLIERLDKMALQVAGINEADEVELVDKWKTETSREADDIVGNSIFKKELEDLRTTKANLKATSEIKGERGESSAKSTPEYWMAKATKGDDGKLRFPEETPKELFGAIVAKLGEKEPGASKGKLKFYNQ